MPLADHQLGLSLHRKFTRHGLEAKMCHEIRTDFLSGLELVEMHSWHYAYADDLSTARDALPRGLVEAGSWWCAVSRLDVTILTFLFWSVELPRTYHTCCSKTMMPFSLFVIACMMDLFDRNPGLLQVTCFFPEAHGQGAVHGHFRCMRHWVSCVADKEVISIIDAETPQ